MRKWFLVALGAVVAAGVVMVVVGAALPQRHVASRTLVLHASPEQVWEVIGDPASFPQWRSDLKGVEMLPPRDGRTAWVEESRHGRITMEMVEASPPVRLVGRIADPNLPFGGTWTYELTPSGEGTRLTITERGEVYNPLFRFMSRYVFGHHATIEAYMKDLAAKFGEKARIEAE